MSVAESVGVIVGVACTDEGSGVISSEELSKVYVPGVLLSSVLVIPFTVDLICVVTLPDPSIVVVLVLVDEELP